VVAASRVKMGPTNTTSILGERRLRVVPTPPSVEYPGNESHDYSSHAMFWRVVLSVGQACNLSARSDLHSLQTYPTANLQRSFVRQTSFNNSAICADDQVGKYSDYAG